MNINELKEKIIYYNKQYRIGNAEIEDSVYDSMLEKLESKMDIFEFEDFKKTLAEEKGTIKLDYVIGSLKKIKYEDDSINDWLKKNNINDIFVSMKIDGCSVVCTYDNGKLIQMVSRGDGYNSTDWTNKSNFINIPKNINKKEKLVIRGELTLINNDHELLGFKNKRNGVVGIMNSKEIDKNKLKFVYAYFYEILSEKVDIKTQFEILEKLSFKIPSYKILSIFT